MLFYIGKSCELLSQVDSELFLDNNWVNQKNTWYKGYSTECNIGHNIQSILDGYQPNGIWAVIHKTNSGYKLYHSELRGFPLFRNECDELTNIPKLIGFNFIDNQVNWIKKFPELTIDEVVHQVKDILVENVNGFLSFNQIDRPIILATGGLDSTLIWAITDSLTSYDLIKSPHRSFVEYDSPIVSYMRENYWSYNSINVLQQDTYTLTGFAAEAMTIRRPDMFNMICRFMDTTVDNTIAKNDYMYHFLQRPDWKKVFVEQTHKVTNLRKSLLQSINADFYMWHLNNNIFASPFYDKRIAEVCVRLNTEALIENCRNGIVERMILKQIRPDFESLVTEYKNHGKLMKNFNENFSSLRLANGMMVKTLS